MRCRSGYDKKWRRKRKWNNGKKSFSKTTMDRSKALGAMSCGVASGDDGGGGVRWAEAGILKAVRVAMFLENWRSQGLSFDLMTFVRKLT